MLDAEVTPARLAELAEVDAKTVQRWLREDRIPYPITRHRVAQALGYEETFLWPELLIDGLGPPACSEAIQGAWPTRTSISSQTWHALFDQARRPIDILIYAGAFLMDTLDLTDVLRFKAARGVVVRVLVGDPDAAAVRARAQELGLIWLAERCRTTTDLLYAQDLGPNVCVRTHGTTLYASHFRFDGTLLINTHAHGVWASQSPVLRIEGHSQLFGFYSAAFERVWALARPRRAPASSADVRSSADA
jgi:hypothetical protein